MQLRLWGTVIDIHAKLLYEKQTGVKVFYHFCGKPLAMSPPPKRRTE